MKTTGRPIRAFETLEARNLLSTSGSLDPTFGQGSGSAAVSFPTSTTAHAVAIQADGKIVVAGGLGTRSGGDQAGFQVARLDADGSLDTTFGVGGKVNLSPAYIADAVAIQADGKIVVAGRTDPGTGLIVARFEPNGSLDTTFGSGGREQFQFSTDLSLVAGLAIQPDGKIVVAGTAVGLPTPAATEFAAARLDADGSLDATFGTGGLALIPITVNGITGDYAGGLAIQPDGKIVLQGTATAAFLTSSFGSSFTLNDLVAVRLDARGSLDPSFGGTGKVILPPTGPTPTDFDATGKGVVIQPDGKIVLAGGSPNAISATRLNADGSLDPGFGDSGVASTTLDVSLDGGLDGYTVALAPDGKVVLAGTASVPDPGTGYQKEAEPVIRFNPDGKPDAAFGNTSTPGASVFAIGTQPLTANALAIQPDGRIVVAGDSNNAFARTGVMTVFRVTGSSRSSAHPVADYQGTGRSDLAVYLPAAGAFAIRPSSGGPDIIVPFGIPGTGQTIPVPGDYDGAGHAEIAAYLPSYGTYAYRPARGGPDVTVPFGMPGPGQSLPAPADYEGSGMDDIAVYMPSIATFGIRPASGGPDKLIPFGIAGPGGSIPAPADYFGTGVADIAVYLPSIGAFAVRPPGGGADLIIPFGMAGAGQSIPTPGDFDGSGHAELGVYMPTLGLFAYRPANGGPDVIVPFGAANDGSVPVVGDYDGSGHDNLAVFDPNYALFAYRPTSGPDVLTVFGSTADFGGSVPVAAPSVTAPVAASIPAASPSPALTARAVPRGPAALVRSQVAVRVAQASPDPTAPGTFRP